MTRMSALVAPLLALVAALLLTALPAAAQPPAPVKPKSAIGVLVLNENDKPVPFAAVQLVNADGKVVRFDHTGPMGRVLFAPVKPGDYVVRAARPGVGKGQENVTAVDHEVAKVVVHLKKQ